MTEKPSIEELSDELASLRQQVSDLRAENERLHRQLGDDAVVNTVAILGLKAELSAAQAKLQQAEGEAAAMKMHLVDVANQYESEDGKVGPLGYNCWGYRDIAKQLRAAAQALSSNAGQPLLAVVEAAVGYYETVKGRGKPVFFFDRDLLTLWDAIKAYKEGRQDAD